jgi:hypothetical protein
LIGIIPDEIGNDFFNKNLRANIPKSKIKIQKEVKKLDNIGIDADSEIYHTVQNNTNVRIITNNHKTYSEYVIDHENNLKYNGLLPGGMCMWCRRECKNPIGIPIKMIFDKKKNISIYWMLHKFCTFNCSYAFLKLVISKDSVYTDSECLLRKLFYFLYPKNTLRESPDWTLLDINGGPLTKDKFFCEKYEYRKLLGIVFFPCKQQYIEINLYSNMV